MKDPGFYFRFAHPRRAIQRLQVRPCWHPSFDPIGNPLKIPYLPPIRQQDSLRDNFPFVFNVPSAQYAEKLSLMVVLRLQSVPNSTHFIDSRRFSWNLRRPPPEASRNWTETKGSVNTLATPARLCCLIPCTRVFTGVGARWGRRCHSIVSRLPIA